MNKLPPSTQTIVAILSLASLTLTAFAAESISQSELKPLLGELTSRWQELKQTYDIKEVGTALTVPKRINPTLADARVLPFEFSARPKGSDRPYEVTIEITGENRFLDSKGREVDLTEGIRCKVEPKEIQVRAHQQ